MKAHMWYKLAGQWGKTEGDYELNRLKNKMSTNQIEEADAMLVRCLQDAFVGCD